MSKILKNETESSLHSSAKGKQRSGLFRRILVVVAILIFATVMVKGTPGRAFSFIDSVNQFLGFSPSAFEFGLTGKGNPTSDQAKKGGQDPGLAAPSSTPVFADAASAKVANTVVPPPAPTFGYNYTIATSASGLDAAIDSLGDLYSAYESGGNVYIKKNLGTAELVSLGSGPVISIDSANNIHVIYTNSGLKYKKRTGAVWGSERTVIPGGAAFYSIDTDSTGAAHIAYDDGGGYGHIVYLKDIGGAWSAPIIELTGAYYSVVSGNGYYYHLPVIRVDSGDKYHLAFEGQNWGGNANWSEKSINIASNSAYGDKGAGGYNWNAGVGLTKNSLTLNGAETYIAYTNGGAQNIALVNTTWTILSSFAGSAGSAYYQSGVVGVSYVNGNVRYIEDAGAGFSDPADLGTGSSPVALLGSVGSRYVFFQNGSDIKLASSQALAPPTPPPTVTTTAATPVASTSALLNGSANPNGDATTGWFRYSTTDPGTCNNTFGTRLPSTGGTDLGSGNLDVPYGIAGTGLVAGTTYYYCAIASNAGGASFGTVLSFTTSDRPTATTNSATAINSSGATLNGSANPNRDSSYGYYRYSASDPGTCSDSFGTRVPSSSASDAFLGSGSTPVAYAFAISGLTPATTYYYCAVARNSYGTAYGAVLTFNTLASAPVVATLSATPVTGISATMNASVNPGGDATTGWFRYSTVSPGTCNDSFGTRAPISGGSPLGSGIVPAALQQSITGLSPATPYYYCAIAQNSVGTSLGAIMSFTTAATPDVAFNTTGSVAGGTYNSITVNAPAVVTVTGDIAVNSCVTVNSGGTLLMGGFTFTGPGCFTLNSGATLGIGSPSGITTGATGNIQTGVRTFDPGATYLYNGSAIQLVGNALPASVANLTIANTGAVGNNKVNGNPGQTVSGLLRVVSGMYASASTYHDVQIDPLGTLTLGGPITVSGNWINNGTLLSNGLGVTFDGTTPQSINGSSVTGFSNLTDSNTTSAVTFNTNFNVSGTFNMNGAGTLFTPGSPTVQINSAGNAGTITGNGKVQVTSLAPNPFSTQYRFVTFGVTALTVEWAGAGDQTIENGVPGYGGIIVSGGGTKMIGGSGTLAINGDVTIAVSTTLAQSLNTLNISGNWTNGGSFIAGTPPIGVVFNGTGAQSIATGGSGTGKAFGLVAVNKSAGTATLAGPLRSAVLAIGSGPLNTSAANSYAVTVTGDVFLTGSGTLAANNSTVTVGGNWANTGTFTAGGSTVIFNGAGVQQTITGSSTFNNLTINHTGANSVGAAGSTLTVAGLMRVQSGTFTSATSYNNVQIDAAANMSLSGPITVSGNWTNSNALAGFTANGFGVTFNGGTGQTVTGDTTFFDLTKSVASPQTMNFTAGSATTVTGALSLTGTAGNLLALRSTAPGTQWNLKATPSQSVGYVDVQDSNALSGSPITTTNSVNSGNDLNWTFVQAPVVYVDPSFTGTPGTDPDGAGPATSIGYDAFATIQGGVNGVADGGQVIVNAGTYSESNNTIDLTRSVTVSGPNSAISPNTGIRVAEAVVTSQGTSISPNGVFRLNIPNLTVTIEGLKFDGTAAAINAYAPNNTISLKKNIFTASHDPGMYFETPNLTIDDNRFVDITSALTEDVIAIGTNVGTNRSPVTIKNNVWTNVAAGALNLDKIAGMISGNQFVNVQYYGMLIVHDSGNLSIMDNLFDGITNPDPMVSPTWGAGVRFYEPAVTSPLFISRNTFKNSYVGVAVRGLPNGAPTGSDITGQPIHVNYNRFFNNATGAKNGATGTLEAENNWWGCNTGPNTSLCDSTGGTVDADPWMILGVSALPNPILPLGTSTVTADMTHNSAAVPVFSLVSDITPVSVPNMPVTFSATSGNMAPTLGTIAGGRGSSLFTSNSALSGTACAAVDNSGVICTNIIVVPQADLAITETDNVTTVMPGGPVTYVTVASNGGPNAVAGATVTDTFPADVTGVTWTCSGTGTCAASGVGNINDNTVALAPGQFVTYTATGTVSPGVGSTISNTAAVSTPAGTVDPDTMNNSATDTDTVEALMQFGSPLYREDESQTAQILITRSGGTSGISSINFSTVAGGTATPGATGTCGTAGVDYETVTNQLVTFVANDTEEIVTVKICGDTSAPPEIPDETIGLQLTPPVPPVTDSGGGAQTTAVLNINDTASQFLQSPVHTSIDMNFATIANPYPSQIVVAGAPNIVGTMRVTLYDISHASPDNMDVLLVGPLGQKYLLVADTGGPFPIDPLAPVTLTFSDFAGGHVPDSGPWTTGQFLPTVCESNSVFAPTAPGGPYVTPNCSTPNPLAQTMFGSGGTGFGLTNPNGTWNLYVRDDAGQLRPTGGDAPNFAVGRIAGGWGLEFLAPTSADVFIGGRVLTDTGRGIRGAFVTVTGNSLTSPINVTTGVNGRYTVPGLTAGETYVVTVRSRRFFFDQPSRVITLNDNVTDADFIGSSGTNREQ